MDDAVVSYEDVPTDFALGVGLTFEFFIDIGNNSDFEPITLDSLKVRGVPLSSVLEGIGFIVTDNTCPEPDELPYEIGILGALNCSFKVQLTSPATSAFRVLDDGGDIEFVISDNDGNSVVEPSYNVKVQAIQNL
ncbi:hypothetical protein BA893_21330 [Vibrio natriegens]|uniref:hypothetical protein n=1 Tax=Vibrio natriegens TaxID=691 RepID=UPI000804132D|nr:hypothetical protein [Vibrio natriegens]ANQ24159.1 hypothetical protein BA893_21330 [Vibrio natriegens]